MGAVIGDLQVIDRIKPGKRWRYVTLDTSTGEKLYLRGYELVGRIREAVRQGEVVVMPNEPWKEKQ